MTSPWVEGLLGDKAGQDGLLGDPENPAQRRHRHHEPDPPGGTVNPDFKIDTSHASVAPPYTGPPIPDFSDMHGDQQLNRILMQQSPAAAMYQQQAAVAAQQRRSQLEQQRSDNDAADNINRDLERALKQVVPPGFYVEWETTRE